MPENQATYRLLIEAVYKANVELKKAKADLEKIGKSSNDLNKKFDRGRITSLIGTHYIVNFTIVPIMLMTLNPWAGLLLFFPGLGFILSNLTLHGTILQPKTM